MEMMMKKKKEEEKKKEKFLTNSEQVSLAIKLIAQRMASSQFVAPKSAPCCSPHR